MVSSGWRTEAAVCRALGKTCIFAAVGTCQLIDDGLKNTRVPNQSTVVESYSSSSGGGGCGVEK